MDIISNVNSYSITITAEPEEIDISTPEVPDQVDAANALDLSESEEEEELEDIINDFTLQEEEMVDTVRPYTYTIYRIRSPNT